MGDAGFFRGTSSDQDGRFSDKEKKLLKQMKFEDTLEKKINMDKVNLDIIKPWITMRINEILGIEDDVVIEYIIGQLEAKNINPKVMQINITGFLNARRAREFMGELWMLLVEADMSDDGIPQSLVDKKLSEMKREAGRNGDSKPPVAVAQNDWANRYQTLSLGRFSGPTKEKEVRDDRMIIPERPSSRSPRRDRDGRDGKGDRDRVDRERGDRDRGERRETRDETPPRRKEFDEREKRRQDDDVKRREDEGKRREEERLKRRAEEKERERRREKDIEKRREERNRRDDKRRRSRSRSRSPVRRRFTEGSAKKRRDGDSSDSEEEVRHKKKKKHSRHSSDDDDEPKERKEKKSKKHKKEKKKKERKRSPTPSTASDTE